MDKKISKVPKKEEQELQERLNKDFVVRNMPAFTSLSGASYIDKIEKNKKNKNNSINNSQGKKHQSVGIFIIAAGFIIIAALLYGAYRFLILPAMQPVVLEPEVLMQTVKKETVSQETVPVVEIIPETVVEPVVEDLASSSEPIAAVVALPLVSDADNDGLSDVAELFLGTNPQLADTDNDNYSDKQELLSGYNPTGAGKLNPDTNLSLYLDPNGFFAAIYPQGWNVNPVNQNSVLFASPDQSLIQISREETDQEYDDILSWYRQQFSDADSLSSDRFLEGSFGVGIISADGQIVYFLDVDNRHIVVVSYIKSGESSPYLELFKMVASTLMSL